MFANAFSAFSNGQRFLLNRAIFGFFKSYSQPKRLDNKAQTCQALSGFLRARYLGISVVVAVVVNNRAWDFGEEEDKEVHKFPLNRGDNKPRRCEQHF